MHQLLPLESPI